MLPAGVIALFESNMFHHTLVPLKVSEFAKNMLVSLIQYDIDQQLLAMVVSVVEKLSAAQLIAELAVASIVLLCVTPV